MIKLSAEGIFIYPFFSTCFVFIDLDYSRRNVYKTQQSTTQKQENDSTQFSSQHLEASNSNVLVVVYLVYLDPYMSITLQSFDYTVFCQSRLLTHISGISTRFYAVFRLSHVSIAHSVVQQPPASFPSTDTHCNRVTYRFRFHSLYFVFYSHFDRFIYSLLVSLLHRRVTRVPSSRTSTAASQRRPQCDRIVFEFSISISVFCVYPEYPFVFYLYLHRFDRLRRIACVQLVEHIDRRIQASISSHFGRY